MTESEDMAFFMAKTWVKYINDNYPMKWIKWAIVSIPKKEGE